MLVYGLRNTVPKTADELDCPPHVKRFLENALKDGFPHLLLYGPPGTGKTTFASILKPTLELNASDDRGIDIIRNKIKKVANTVAPQVILLDECENLTKDSQTCLRRILEDFPNTRFIFCTNYYSRIIDPLKSRLLKIKFTLKESRALERIGKSEGMDHDPSFYKDLFRKCNGDLRKCLNILQGIKPLATFDIEDLIGRAKDEVVDGFMKITDKNYEAFIDSFIFEGYSALQLIHQLNERIFEIKENDKQRCEFVKILAECESKCLIGCSEDVVLNFLCLNYILIN
ncbi:uncharacterized protein VICG_01825 [Vittaforma corneae ATCC 50505]|uniref:AAA+ ATPase domain-containing protein n=1 Tax=Vittaforma corneae (strain ATCC 50505) TaxID=993615 RepID=L2GJW3_VITCO|nr:uncharacterized protein VICG_01825 [Vittaforma corneae ATCC 50505]ELA41126.1 hypothetical protein VICG_01825 [Vittaforma corneae ATCC 50505]